jgi:hypothetical protein
MKGLKAGTHGYAYKHYEYKTRADALKVIRVRDLFAQISYSACWQKKCTVGVAISKREATHTAKGIMCMYRGQ